MMLKLAPYSKLYLEYSWEWLNDPEIKELTNTPDFNKKDQLKFFEKLKDRSDYKIFGLEVDGVKMGVCGLKNIQNDKAEYFGYIGEKTYWGKGYGNQMLIEIESVAREMNITKLFLNVLKNNLRAQKLYFKFGFQITKDENDNLEMEKNVNASI